MNKVNSFESSWRHCALALALSAMIAGASADQSAAPAAAASVAPIPALLIANAERSMLLGVSQAGDGIVAVGGNGVIVRSTDGKSWRQIKSPVDTALNAVAFADKTHGWAVGHDAVILGTSDGGATWAVQNFQPDINAPIFSVLALSGDKALAVGAFGLIKQTGDGGKTWTDVAAPEISSDKLHLNGITQLKNGKIIVAGERGLVGISADGQKWTRLATLYEGSFFGVLPWGEKGAITYGMRGNVYQCDDVDSPNWKKIETSTTSSFFGGELLPEGAVLLTGSENTVITIQPTGLVSASRKIGKLGASDGSLTGSLRTATSEIVIGESGVGAMAAN